MEVVERRRRAWRWWSAGGARGGGGAPEARVLGCRHRQGIRRPARAVVIFGSVARGDFNDTSDIDVLVVAERLPARATDRLAALGAYPSIPGASHTFPPHPRENCALRSPPSA
ncbi:MAG: nucleotidyltransferase family protein [Egibacteraceae bacterium]